MMKNNLTKSITDFSRPTAFLSARILDSFCRKKLFAKMKRLRQGFISFEDADGVFEKFGDTNAPADVRTHVRVTNARAYSRIALGGSVGTGESYVDGDWEASNLVALVRIFVMNRDVLNALDSGLGAFFQPLQRALHRFRSNHEEQACANIRAHYDLGNDFFNLFLGPTWMYSSGIYPSPTATLEEAQYEKNDRICRKLRIKPEQTLVEIGTGWGGFAIHAAKHYGCHVTTTTISQAQYDFAKARIISEKLEDRITLLLKDYRTLEGTFDHLVSIEMIEAVGLKYFNTYFKKCSSLLKPDGSMCLQGILIQDQFYQQAAKSVDFIQTHVFPGSAIPSVSRIMESIQKQTDLKLFHLEDFGLHYARTLNEWHARLNVQREEFSARGYSDALFRLWRYYFAYCEGGFLEKQISVAQFVFTKPRHENLPVLIENLETWEVLV
ncbi:MAG: class I SAM-dependent methyltransferase [Cryobacterium sp.]|nr:class I SAM-dependent methyltransferase [Oligoflexia bacterium]